jgi:hypothetical protein
MTPARSFFRSILKMESAIPRVAHSPARLSIVRVACFARVGRSVSSIFLPSKHL